MGVGNEKWIIFISAVLVICGFGAAAAHGHSHGDDHHGCGHANHHHHHEDDHLNHVHRDEVVAKRQLLPEELAEEEDLKSHGFAYGVGDHQHHQDNADLSGIGLWMHAMGCSLLVSLASLICLVLLPLIFIQGKPSKAIVDSLALFGAGAMLGDAFLHQLPHAFGCWLLLGSSQVSITLGVYNRRLAVSTFLKQLSLSLGGEHSHSHDHHSEHHHSHPAHEHLPSHSHSLADLSVGLSILAGIILFLLVEKLVRYVEGSSGTAESWSHGHHHHQKHSKKLITDNDNGDENVQGLTKDEKNDSPSADSGDNIVQEEFSVDASNGEKHYGNSVLRKRNVGTGSADDEDNRNRDTCAAVNVADRSAPDGPADKIKETLREPAKLASSLVFGYLNLFSDGVHNFTDGMALGSAFLLYGSIGGWSRTLFLLAHELPQEIGDFGILVRSGFSVSKALFFNFLSALVALVGTAMALMMGQNPGQSSLIEGFTAGGFIYISVAGVLAEMNNGTPTLKSTTIQLLSLLTGMVVALCISLAE